MRNTSKYQELSDDELLIRHRQSRDNEWLGVLLQRYTVLLYGVALKYLKDKDLSADAVQQIFLKALTHLPKERIENIKGWLYILMRNHCLQCLRDRGHLYDADALKDLAAQTPVDESELFKKEYTLEQLLEAVKELAEEQKLSITYFYLEKKSYQQIMELTGYSFMQVKSYIQNGKRNLKKLLEKRLDHND